MKAKNIFAIMTMAAVVGTTATVSCSSSGDDKKESATDKFVATYQARINAYSAENSEINLFSGDTILKVEKDGDGLKVSATLNTPVGPVVISGLKLTSLTLGTKGSKTADKDGYIYYAEGYHFVIASQSITVGGYGNINFEGNGDDEVDDSGVYDEIIVSPEDERDEKSTKICFSLVGTVTAPNGTALPNVGDIIIFVEGTKK
jgi:hypothetical protein